MAAAGRQYKKMGVKIKRQGLTKKLETVEENMVLFIFIIGRAKRYWV